MLPYCPPASIFGQKASSACFLPTHVPLFFAERAQPPALLPAPHIVAFLAVGCVSGPLELKWGGDDRRDHPSRPARCWRVATMPGRGSRPRVGRSRGPC